MSGCGRTRSLLQPLRRFLQSGGDLSGEDAVRAVAATSGAGAVVVPTLLYEAGAWKARAEVRDRGGAVVGRLETPSIESSLSKEAAAALIVSLAEQIEGRFQGSRWRLGGAPARPARFQSLEAAKAFEEGFSAFDAGEFAAARDAFARAAREDPRHPLPAAWQARVAHLTGDRGAAVEAADRAEARLSTASPAESMFVQAVVAEARRQPENAARWYDALAAADPDDQSALAELAGYQDRSGRTTDAIASYRRLLELDAQQPGPALELCRLYSPARMNDSAMARAFAERARRAYAAFGSPAGEAQAMLCLSDVLRGGTPAERAESRAARHAGPAGVRVARAAVQRGARALLRRVRGPRRGRSDGGRRCARARLGQRQVRREYVPRRHRLHQPRGDLHHARQPDESPRLLSPEL